MPWGNINTICPLCYKVPRTNQSMILPKCTLGTWWVLQAYLQSMRRVTYRSTGGPQSSHTGKSLPAMMMASPPLHRVLPSVNCLWSVHTQWGQKYIQQARRYRGDGRKIRWGSNDPPHPLLCGFLRNSPSCSDDNNGCYDWRIAQRISWPCYKQTQTTKTKQETQTRCSVCTVITAIGKMMQEDHIWTQPGCTGNQPAKWTNKSLLE